MIKTRARLAILNTLLQFPTISQKDWTGGAFGEDAIVGDLVSLNCAPISKWYLSWVHEIEKNERTGNRYLLESIEDGELCWWGNVGVSVYNRERVSNNPTWKWTDDQFLLNDRWNRVFRRNDAYMLRPCLPTFNEDGSVTLNVRVRFSTVNFSNLVTFPNWKKLTMRQMDQYYKDSLNAFENRPKKEAA